MVLINEWLPNPVGADAAGEWVELWNGGGTAVDLKGWVLKTENGKKFSLTGQRISAHGYLVLKRTVTKLSLRNTDGGLALYDAGGALADRGNFDGSAPEGQSFSRADYAMGPAQHFAFADPTPAAPNATARSAVVVRGYPAAVPLNRGFTNAAFSTIMVGTAVLLAGLIIYAIKANEDLSKLFFGRDKNAR
ncbi:MAG: lamin tail domain-containing protein [Minisyncoccia bacterium]|jgi:hypothetical protein